MLSYNTTWNLVVFDCLHTVNLCKQFLSRLCDGPHSEASFRGWRVYKYGLEASTMRRPTPQKGSCARGKRNVALHNEHVLRRSYEAHWNSLDDKSITLTLHLCQSWQYMAPKSIRPTLGLHTYILVCTVKPVLNGPCIKRNLS